MLAGSSMFAKFARALPGIRTGGEKAHTNRT